MTKSLATLLVWVGLGAIAPFAASAAGLAALAGGAGWRGGQGASASATPSAGGPTGAAAAAPSSAAATAIVKFALDQLGKPYLWGGEGRGGFDCSGLTQAAYAAAGIRIPRTSEAQWSALPRVPLEGLVAGDLIYFEPGEFVPGLPGHVGVYIGGGAMVDAPHTGALVRVDFLEGGPLPFGATAVPTPPHQSP